MQIKKWNGISMQKQYEKRLKSTKAKIGKVVKCKNCENKSKSIKEQKKIMQKKIINWLKITENFRKLYFLMLTFCF